MEDETPRLVVQFQRRNFLQVFFGPRYFVEPRAERNHVVFCVCVEIICLFGWGADVNSFFALVKCCSPIHQMVCLGKGSWQAHRHGLLAGTMCVVSIMVDGAVGSLIACIFSR